LITWKGRKILTQADAILYDHLANDALLDLAQPACERLYVGKKQSIHSFTQEEICQMLVSRAQRGLTVVRLKGGDPFIFGRGGEEAEALAKAGVPFEVVPGVTTALGLAAYSGVPLTHRKQSRMVSFVTGHDAQGIDWNRACEAETLVIYMGLLAFHDIARELIARGRNPETPAIAVRWATRPDQKTVTGTLATLPDLIDAQGLTPPTTIVVGEVTRLHSRLNWFERLPLFGTRIVVTRAQGQAAELSDKLRSLGADAVELPVIQIAAASNFAPLDGAISNLSDYDWLIFTSVNGVRYFMERLDHSKADLRLLRARICTIGPATRAAVEALHLKVDLIPAEYVAESLVQAFAEHDLNGKQILLPRAAIARDVVPVELAKRGARVHVVEAYRTIVPPHAVAQAKKIFGSSKVPHWVTFTSSSTVKNFLAAAGPDALDGVRVASIGPVTTATAKMHGLHVDVEATPYTIDGLIVAMLNASAIGQP
jgi:uroporphyrinogen III methyltransferase/synthase